MLRKIFIEVKVRRFRRAEPQGDLAGRRFGVAATVGLEPDITEAQEVGATGRECGLVRAESEIAGLKHLAEDVKEISGGPVVMFYERPEFDDGAVQ